MAYWAPFIVLIVSPMVYPLCEHIRTSPFYSHHPSHSRTKDLNLSICKVLKTGDSCCTRQSETAMAELTKRELNSVYQDRVIALRYMFNQHYRLFERQYIQAITTSSRQLHAMFTRTYGHFYQSHTEIFVKLFDDLQASYSGPKYIPLKPILDKFFFDLFRTLLLILNPTDKIEAEDIDCLKSAMPLQPFGEVPQKMARQLERSLGAARTFTNVLKSSTDILQPFIQDELPESCTSAVTRMKYCALCDDQPLTLQTCEATCLTTLKNCFTDHISMEETWQKFIDALTKLAVRLKGPYNVVAVVIPLAVQISESIMVFQEKAQQISSKVVRKCLHKDKEQSIKQEQSFQPATAPLPDFSDTIAEAHSQLLSAFIEKVQATKDFWSNGPSLTCVNNSWAALPNETCWDGTQVHETNDDVENAAVSSIQTDKFAEEKLKLTVLSNQLLDSHDGRQMYNFTMELDISSGEMPPYVSVDDEDGDDGSGSDPVEDVPLVIDIAGSHRDTVQPTFTDTPSSTTTSTSTLTSATKLQTVTASSSGISNHLLSVSCIVCLFRIF